ncbi:cytochrome c biogenesis protein ResB [Desulfococcaceae bacterium HSG8]|nr:cytochrome c biogenesis protein ResB [Desulfococcaceae bacterium HSG8]
MEKGESSSYYFNKLWKFFASVRLTVIILLSLAATSVIGTVIPQNAGDAAYLRKYGEVLYRIFHVLDIFDMYHSWWFQFLLLMLTMNIIICSAERLSSTWKIIFPGNPRLNISRFRKHPDKEEFIADCPMERLKDTYTSFMSEAFGYTEMKQSDDGVCILAEKGRWTRMGVYIVHISVILLLLGGLAGSMFGFEGFVNIPEGGSTDHIRLRKTDQIKQLDFTIRCNDFSVSFYDSGAPEEFRSSLSVLENGKLVLDRDIIVNDPLRYKGISMFQSSYGKLPLSIERLKGKAITLDIKSKATGMSYTEKAIFGQKFDLPENMGTFVIKDFDDSYGFRGHNIGESFVGELITGNGEPLDIAMPVRFPQFDMMRKGDFIVSVVGYDYPYYYTGLQVTKDPGVVIVYTGFVLMIIGFYITFFMSHQRLCVELAENNGKSRVKVSGIADRNKMGMETRTKKLSERLAALSH